MGVDEKKATVSVGIPVYNGAEHLKAALDSVLSNIEQIDEVIVSNDASTDASAQILSQYVHPKIKLKQQQTSLGMVQNWNFLIDQMQSKYVCLFHQDDVCKKGYFEKMVSEMEQNNADLAYCDVDTIDSQGQIYEDPKFLIKKSFHQAGAGSVVWDPKDLFLRLFFGNIINCPTAMYKKDLFAKIGLFDPRYSFVQDWDFWFRATQASAMVLHVPMKLYEYRVHQNNATAKYKSNFKKYDERQLILKEYLKKIPLDLQRAEVKKRAYASLSHVLLWDAFEALSVGDKEIFSKKLSYGDESIEGFSNYLVRRWIGGMGFFGKTFPKIFFWALPRILAFRSLFKKTEK